jgi:hypothetical protein
VRKHDGFDAVLVGFLQSVERVLFNLCHSIFKGKRCPLAPALGLSSMEINFADARTSILGPSARSVLKHSGGFDYEAISPVTR